MSKEIPILFSTPMVQAILAGRKSQTRRIIKPQPRCANSHVDVGFDPKQVGWAKEPFQPRVTDGFVWCADCGEYIGFNSGEGLKCPYGKCGDILWVRETWDWVPTGKGEKIGYKADGEPAYMNTKWKPSIFMPKEACRIRLEITNIRVERLHNISEQDAIEEGIEPEGEGWKSYEIIHAGRHKGEPAPHSVVPNKSPVTSYMELWQSINDLESWGQNPWVWVINFKKL